MQQFTIDSSNMEIIEEMSEAFPYLLGVSRYSKLPSHTVVWHWHEEFEFGFLKRGSLKIYTNEGSFEIKEGEGYLINTNIMHMLISQNPKRPAISTCILFHPILIAGHFHSVFEKKYVSPIAKNPHLQVLRFSKDNEIGKKIIDALKQLESLEGQPDNEFEIRNILSTAWKYLVEDVKLYISKLPKEGFTGRDRLQYMISYIHRHYMDKITLEDIAESAHISTREATRCFKRIRGKSPIDYLIEYRLNMAGEMLTNSDDNVTTIAMKVGFNDSAYFGKMFRRQFGVTPVEYRKAVPDDDSDTSDMDPEAVK